MPAETVLDPGPIPYPLIALHGDPDLEQGLRHAGFNPESTAYRLVEIPVAGIAEAASMPSWRHMGTTYIDALKAGQEFPPIVVMRTARGWALIDGVNRTHAHLSVKRLTIRAYELLGS